MEGDERIGNCVLMVNKLGIKSIKKKLGYDLLPYKLCIDSKIDIFSHLPGQFRLFLFNTPPLTMINTV